MDEDLLSVGETAERTGVAPSALRVYEAEGLISSTRTAGNQRRYHREVLRRVAFIKAAQPLHNDAAAGAGWTKEQYDRLQAIK